MTHKPRAVWLLADWCDLSDERKAEELAACQVELTDGKFYAAGGRDAARDYYFDRDEHGLTPEQYRDEGLAQGRAS